MDTLKTQDNFVAEGLQAKKPPTDAEMNRSPGLNEDLYSYSILDTSEDEAALAKAVEPMAIAGGIANSTALARIWSKVPAQIRQQITYTPTTEIADSEAAVGWLQQQSNPIDAINLLRANGDPTLLGLTAREKVAAQAHSIAALARSSAALRELPMDQQTEDTQEVRHQLDALLSESLAVFTRDASADGGILQSWQSFHKIVMAADPSLWVKSIIVTPIAKEQKAKLTQDPAGKAAKKSLTKARKSAAASATSSLTSIFQRLTQRFLGDDAQLTFDFFNDSIGIPDSVTAKSLRERKEALTENIAGKIADQLRISAMLDPKSAMNPTEAQIEAAQKLMATVRSQVASQIEQVFAADTVTMPAETAEQKSERLLSSALDTFSAGEIAQKIFDDAKSRIMAMRDSALPEVQKAIDEQLAPATFDPAKLSKFATAIRQLVNFRTLARQGFENQQVAREAMTDQLAAQAESLGNPLTDAQKNQLTKVLNTVFNAELAKATQREIDALKRQYMGDKKSPLRELDADRFVRLAATGQLSDENFYNALAPYFKMPSWSPEVAAAFTEQARRISKLNPNTLMSNEATTRLMQQMKLAAEETARKFSKGAKFRYLGRIADSLWVSGSLSGVPTQLVNTTMTAANVWLELGHLAAGNYKAAIERGVSKDAAKTFFTDVMNAYRTALSKEGQLGDFVASGGKDVTGSFLNSPAGLEIQAAWTTGITKSTAETKQHLMPLEEFNFQMPTSDQITSPKQLAKVMSANWLALNKYVGRALLAEDSLNRIVARSGAELMYRRSVEMMTEEGGAVRPRTAEELKESMQKFLSPDETLLDDMRAQVAAELEGGQFDLIPEKQRKFYAERRMAELRNQMFDADTRRKAEEFAAEATLNGPARGFIGWALMETFGRFNNVIPVFGRVIMPFSRMMSVLANQTLAYSPYGFARANGFSFLELLKDDKSTYAQQDLQKGSAEYFAAMRKATIGSSFMVGLVTLAAAALFQDKDDPFFDVTGDGPDDPKLRIQLEQNRDASGQPTWVRNSIRLKLGGKRILLRFSDYPAISGMLSAVGAVSDTLRYNKEKQNSSYLGMTLKVVQNAILSMMGKDMLRGTRQLATAMSPSAKDWERSAATSQLMGGLVSGFTNPGIIRSTMQAFVPPRNAYEKDQGIASWLLAHTPLAPFTARPAFNVLGEPIQSNPYETLAGRVLPSGFSDEGGHPILGPILKAGLVVPVPSTLNFADGSSMDRTNPLFYDYSKTFADTVKAGLIQYGPQIIELAKTNKEAAQKVLISSIGRAARNAGMPAAYEGLRKQGKLVAPKTP